MVRRVLDLSVASVARRLDFKYRLARLLGKSSLTLEQSSLLAEMRTDNLRAPSPFRASEVWDRVVKLFDRVFRLEGIGDVEEQYFNLRFSGFAPGDPRLHRYLVYTYFHVLRGRDVHGLLKRIPATEPVKLGMAYEIDGCKVSLDLLFSIDEFYSLLELRPDLMSEPLIVADIGAGWGRLGYVLKRVNPRLTYVIFDLPEILLISSTYLPRLLTGEECRSYRQAKEIPPLSRQVFSRAGVWFLGSHDLPRVQEGSLDVVVNIGSFQEMTETQVGQYFQIISEKGRGGHLYLKESWSIATHGEPLGEISGHGRYPFPSAWEKVFLRNVTFSPDYFETAYRIR
jgi:putative sugar O-methyltransferase